MKCSAPLAAGLSIGVAGIRICSCIAGGGRTANGDGMRRVSSIFTPLQKLLGPALVLTFVLVVFQGRALPWPSPLLLLVGALLIGRTRGLAEAVYDDEAGLLVRVRGVEETIPFDVISAVEERIWIQPRTLTLRFKQPCRVGASLTFIPVFDPSMIFPPFESQLARDLRWRSGLAEYR